MSISEETDTLVIGAGAAGLAAAFELASHGRQVMVLEARERPGGRILTDSRSLAPLPIELGAEFIHGESSTMANWLKASGDVAIDASRARWITNGAKLRSAEARLQELKRVFGRLPLPRPDVSLGEFLHRHRRAVPPMVRQFAAMLIEGFDAADVSRISAREVLDELTGPAAVDGPTFRPARGYDHLIQSIRQALPAERVILRFGTIVQAVNWRKGHVSVEARRREETVRIRASCAIVTFPLSVLQLPAGSPRSVSFAPELDSKRTAFMHLAVGSVIKVVMHFARPFWAELHEARYRDAAFFFAPKAAFPAFWTTLPVRTSLLTAWCAGPRAGKLAGKSQSEIIASVTRSLGEVFGRRNYSSMLEGVFWHDWQRDPFSCGAYSYVLAGGAGARRSLARPVQNTLFFAGEACDTAGQAATVGGALRSGARAAKEVLAR